MIRDGYLDGKTDLILVAKCSLPEDIVKLVFPDIAAGIHGRRHRHRLVRQDSEAVYVAGRAVVNQPRVGRRVEVVIGHKIRIRTEDHLLPRARPVRQN